MSIDGARSVPTTLKLAPVKNYHVYPVKVLTKVCYVHNNTREGLWGLRVEYGQRMYLVNKLDNHPESLVPHDPKNKLQIDRAIANLKGEHFILPKGLFKSQSHEILLPYALGIPDINAIFRWRDRLHDAIGIRKGRRYSFLPTIELSRDLKPDEFEVVEKKLASSSFAKMNRILLFVSDEPA